MRLRKADFFFSVFLSYNYQFLHGNSQVSLNPEWFFIFIHLKNNVFSNSQEPSSWEALGCFQSPQGIVTKLFRNYEQQQQGQQWNHHILAWICSTGENKNERIDWSPSTRESSVHICHLGILKVLKVVVFQRLANLKWNVSVFYFIFLW